MGEEHSFLLQGPPGPWLPCWSSWGTYLVMDTLIGCHTPDMQKRHMCERHVKQLLREASGGEDAALPPLSPTRQELTTHLPGPAESEARPQSARTNADALSPAPGRWRPSLPATQRAPASPWVTVGASHPGVFVLQGVSAHSFLRAQRTLAPPSRPSSGVAASGSDSYSEPSLAFAWGRCSHGT